MKLATRIMLTLVLATFLASSAIAQNEEKKKKRSRNNKRRSAAASVVQFVRLSKEIQSTFTEEQKKQIAAIAKEFAPKIAAIQKKQRGILSQEQRKAQRAATVAAKEAGKKGKKAREAVAAAVKLTDAQKKQQAEVRKESQELRDGVMKKVVALLTPEQKDKLPKRAQGQGKKKRNKKKTKKEA